MEGMRLATRDGAACIAQPRSAAPNRRFGPTPSTRRRPDARKEKNAVRVPSTLPSTLPSTRRRRSPRQSGGRSTGGCWGPFARQLDAARPSPALLAGEYEGWLTMARRPNGGWLTISRPSRPPRGAAELVSAASGRGPHRVSPDGTPRASRGAPNSDTPHHRARIYSLPAHPPHAADGRRSPRESTRASPPALRPRAADRRRRLAGRPSVRTTGCIRTRTSPWTRTMSQPAAVPATQPDACRDRARLAISVSM